MLLFIETVLSIALAPLELLGELLRERMETAYDITQRAIDYCFGWRTGPQPTDKSVAARTVPYWWRWLEIPGIPDVSIRAEYRPVGPNETANRLVLSGNHDMRRKCTHAKIRYTVDGISYEELVAFNDAGSAPLQRTLRNVVVTDLAVLTTDGAVRPVAGAALPPVAAQPSRLHALLRTAVPTLAAAIVGGVAMLVCFVCVVLVYNWLR